MLGFLRQWKEEEVLVLHNLNSNWQEMELQLELTGDSEILYSDGEVEWGSLEGEKAVLKLSPRSSLIISLKQGETRH